MVEWRRYTGTQFLQAIWTIVVLAIGSIVQLMELFTDGLLNPVVFVTGSGLWISGLLVIALYDWRHWNRMVANSSFQPNTGTRIADLETIKKGRSVTGNTEVPDALSQTHMTIRTAVEGVGASFTIQFRYVGEGGTSEGLQVGTDALDEAFVIRGSEQNVGRLLSPEIQAILMEIETPGTMTVTGNEVEYKIPFTRLSPAELETVAEATVEIAEQIESLAAE